MGRDRQFSPDAVLQQVAALFATQGYAGTSLSQLSDATSLGKQSLYNCFGDKRALYLQAVDCAVQRFAAVAFLMARAATGRAALQVFFDDLFAQLTSDDPAAQACIVSAGLLEGLVDEGIRAALQSKWADTHELLRAQVERGQRDGSIVNPLPSADVADDLMTLMSGLRVAARAPLKAQRLGALVRRGLATLDHAGAPMH
jgi:TetR/AcrR family transcriptional regulator, transcriptional repressor for nem operon